MASRSRALAHTPAQATAVPWLAARGALIVGLAALAVAWIADLAAQVRAIAVGGELMDDFPTYHAAAVHVLDGHGLYAPMQMAPYPLTHAAAGFGFVYPPIAALVAAPLAVLPEIPAYAVVTGLSFAAFWCVATAIVRSEGFTGWVPLAATTVLVLANGPVLSGVKTGNLNLAVAASLGLLWLAPRTSGWVAVAGGLVKLYPAAGLVWARRRGGPVAVPLAVGVLLLVASVAIQGPNTWLDYGAALRNLRPDSWYPLQSPGHLFGPIVGIACSAVLLVGALRVRDDALAFGLLALAMLAPAPDLWSHYLLIAEIGFLPLACRALRAVKGSSRMKPEPSA